MCYQSVQIAKTRNGYIDHVGGRYMMVACRQCLECRQVRAKEWALRCMMEAWKYNQNCFVTLTYAKSPVVLIKKDLQDFMKRLRKSLPSCHKIKYFACGEYGDQKRRPHFHILLFNYDFADKYEFGTSERGYPLYNSETLERLWGKGLVTIQDMTINTAGYCALYSAEPRKRLPKHLREHPEFNLMSQGLGVDVMLRKIDTYLKTDEIWYDGKKYNIPQCVLNKHFTEDERKFGLAYRELKNRRIAKSKDPTRYESVVENRYRKENAKKRLTNTL